ncbi:MAG TPA: outer membrane protein [Pseudolabrys sp.]|nr:outer membrane protein [Pseudolabrys sp.]
MRRLVLLSLLAAATLGGGRVQAADLPVKAPIYKAPILYNWSGCYIGGHAGAGWARTEGTNTVNTTAFGDLAPGDGASVTKSGFVGGGQLGCNYQINQWVLGIEGTFSGTSIKGSVINSAFGAGDDVFETRVNSIFTVVGRIGYAFNNWLPYIKGGYAGASNKLSVSDTAGMNQGAGSESKWHNGWTIGGGLEYGLTQNWIIGLEYNYIGLQTKNYNVAGADPGIYAFDVKPRIHEVLARVSYKF